MEPSAVAVIDIDGVVADVRHRLHHLRRTPARWDRFFAEAPADPLLEVGAGAARDLASEYPVVWLSGRPEWLRTVTQTWLDGYQLPGGRLLLRADGDYRPAARFKLSEVRRLARSRRIAAMLDDDPLVVRTIRTAGFPIVLADWVPHERALHEAQERHGRT